MQPRQYVNQAATNSTALVPFESHFEHESGQYHYFLVESPTISPLLQEVIPF